MNNNVIEFFVKNYTKKTVKGLLLGTFELPQIPLIQPLVQGPGIFTDVAFLTAITCDIMMMSYTTSVLLSGRSSL